MDRIAQLLGREVDVDTVGRALYADAGELQASIVGGVLITCSDESERQVRDAFQRNFAEHLLPSLKFGERSFFRLANLGGRYETGAVEIARQHYSPDDAGKGFGLLVVKINSHVCGESAQLMIEDDTLAAGPVTRALATRFDSSEQHDGRRE